VRIPEGQNVDEFVSRQFGGRQFLRISILLTHGNQRLGPIEYQPPRACRTVREQGWDIEFARPGCHDSMPNIRAKVLEHLSALPDNQCFVCRQAELAVKLLAEVVSHTADFGGDRLRLLGTRDLLLAMACPKCREIPVGWNLMNLEGRYPTPNKAARFFCRDVLEINWLLGRRTVHLHPTVDRHV
jgi:hypothetical protein